MGKRLKLTAKQHQELLDARDWCASNGLDGLKSWYDDELAWQEYRRALPTSAQQVEDDDDESH